MPRWECYSVNDTYLHLRRCFCTKDNPGLEKDIWDVQYILKKIPLAKNLLYNTDVIIQMFFNG